MTNPLQTNTWLPRLRSVVAEGLPVYGGSAGAALLGSTIDTIAGIDTNSVGIVDTTGAGVIGEAAVWVHFRPSDVGPARNFSERYEVPLVALPEEGGAIYECGVVTSCGYQSAWLFRVDHVAEVPPGSSIELR